jgi:hypothetical protein
MNLDRLNDALSAGLNDAVKQKTLDDGFNVVGQFVYKHGHIPDEAFQVSEQNKRSIYDCSKEDVITMLIDDICDQVFCENTTN